MTKQNIVIAIAGGVIGLILSAVFLPKGDSSFGNVYEITKKYFVAGFEAGSNGQFAVSESGAVALSNGLSLTSTGTTSPSFTSSSATQGVCIPFNATSTNTLLSLTFRASSTASVTNVFPAGVVPVVSYGACL